MKTIYCIHLINPVEDRLVYEVAYTTDNRYSVDPYTMHEHGAFIRLQAHPARLLFIPWTNITHVETERVD